MNLFEHYKKLLSKYGAQGWWPLIELHKNNINPTKTGSMNGYHPNDHSYPKNNKQIFEICLGAILTQNTSWTNVEKAVMNLNDLNVIDPYKIIDESEDKIKLAIKPSGYFNQKYKKIIEFFKFFIKLKENQIPTREELLELWGIGFETADSILLYAYRIPVFIVDTYTKRFLISLDLIQKDWDYNKIQELIENDLGKNIKDDQKVIIYQEFHALIVEYNKRIK